MSEENPQKIDDCDACSVKTLEYIRGKLRLAVHGGLDKIVISDPLKSSEDWMENP